MTDLAADLDLIRDAAEAAGRLALAERDAGLKVWSKEGGSPVTSADLAVDQLLRDALLSARPDYGWLSEETADSAEGESVTVCAQGGLRMRKKPKGRYMQMIPDGAQLAVLEEKDGWLRVEYRGFTGWISGEYCCKAGED